MISVINTAQVFLFLCCAHSFHFQSRIFLKGNLKASYQNFDSNEIQIFRILGHVDIFYNQNIHGHKQGGSVSIRIFESKLLDGTKCFLKEYSPSAYAFGKREQFNTNILQIKWDKYVSQFDSMSRPSQYFPSLIGYLITDETIESDDFRAKWFRRFPSSRPPTAGIYT